MHNRPVAGVDVGSEDAVDEAPLILQRDEVKAFGGRRSLMDDIETCRANLPLFRRSL